MAVTDLTGTKWLLKENADIYGPTGGGSDDVTYSINFSSKNNNYILFMFYGGGKYSHLYYGVTNQSSDSAADYYYRTDTLTWTDQDYRTIEITGGTDATNSDLISWLQANATQIQEQSNTLSFGNLPIKNVYFGTRQVKKVYLGNTLVWEKAVTLISFSFMGTSYQAEVGMTWTEFINSQYNTGNAFSIQDNRIISSTNYFVNDHNGISVTPSDRIIANEAYIGQYNYDIVG